MHRNVLFYEFVNELGITENFTNNESLHLTKKSSRHCRTCWGKGEVTYALPRGEATIIRLCNCVLRRLEKEDDAKLNPWKYKYNKNKVYGGLKTVLDQLKEMK